MICTVVNCGFNSCSLGDLKGSHCSVWQILKKITNYLGFKSQAHNFNGTQLMKFNHLTALVALLQWGDSWSHAGFLSPPQSHCSAPNLYKSIYFIFLTKRNIFKSKCRGKALPVCIFGVFRYDCIYMCSIVGWCDF